ncbi:MAG: DUF2306 domain-containing protein [Pseudomonadota bacterium]
MELLERFWADNWVGQAHFLLAMVALISGPLIFSQAKGTQAHRWLGYTYLASMLIVNISALTIYDLTQGINLFHIFAVVSLSSIIPGIWCVLRGKIESHYFFMSWSYFGLLAAFLSQIATQTGGVPKLAKALGGGGFGFTIIFVGSGLAGFIASRIINRQAKVLLPRYSRDR